MSRTMDEALTECLNRIARGQSLEESLRGYESIASHLRPMLEAALALQRAGQLVPDFSGDASRNVRARMQAERARQAERRRPGLPWRAAGLLGAAAAAAAVAFVAFGMGLPDLGSDTSVAQAQGVVASSAANSVVLTTPDGEIVIRIGEKTVVLDAGGKVIGGEQIVPGTRANIEFEEADDGLSGVRIEIEDDDENEGDENDDSSNAGPQGQGPEVEFSGVIQSINGNTLVLSTGFGPATVRIDSGTDVKGPLQVGGPLKVHATRETNGTYLAREIEVAEVEDDGSGDGTSADDHAGGAGSGSGSDDAGTQDAESESEDSSDDGAPETDSSDSLSD